MHSYIFITSDVPKDDRRISERNRLVFHNVTVEDKMVIQCNASNKHGYIYENAYVNIMGKYIQNVLWSFTCVSVTC